MTKTRIDILLVERGLTPTREKAQALVMAGCVFVEGVKVEKSGHRIDPVATVDIRGQDHPYVGRGGVKLAHALDHFAVDATGKICMDVGASTGGFTDCLLQRGAAKVYAVDVGYGQLAWRIAQDPCVVAIERTNIRTMDRDSIPEAIDIAVIDVSFISLTLVLPAVDRFVKANGAIIALVKPQFEVGRGRVGKGGIVRDEGLQREAVEKIVAAGAALGWTPLGATESPIQGAKGNREFLAAFRSADAGGSVVTAQQILPK